VALTQHAVSEFTDAIAEKVFSHITLVVRQESDLLDHTRARGATRVGHTKENHVTTRPDLVEQAVAAKVLAELVKQADATVRAALLEELLDEYRATGKKTFDASAFGLAGIGTITLPEGKDKAVVADSEAFLRYVEDHHPDAVRTVSVPDPEWQRSLLSQLDLSGEAPVNPFTGEAVPGLAIDRAGEPKKFNVNLAKATAPAVTAAVLSQTVSSLTEAAALEAAQ